MEYNATPQHPNPHDVDPHLYVRMQPPPVFNPVERNFSEGSVRRHTTHTLPRPIARHAVSHPNISPSLQQWPTGTNPPIDHATTRSTKQPTSSFAQQSATASLPPPQPIHHQCYPPAHRLTLSRPAYQQKPHHQQQQHLSTQSPTQQTPFSIPQTTAKPRLPLPTPHSQNHHPIPPKLTGTLLPPAPKKPGRIIHTLLPPAQHIIRPNTPIRPFILSLPLGTPFHKRYKALLFFTRTHGGVVQSTFLAAPYFSYRDPLNNQVHFLINNILVQDGRWSDELSYEVQVMESGLGVLDRDRRTWGNHWRETREEKEGVVVFEGGSERSVVLFWYGTQEDGSDNEGGLPEVEDDMGEEGKRLLEEGIWRWVS